MVLMDICENADILSVIRIVNIVINIIKVIVPIILIVSLMLDYMNAVKDNDSDALAKAGRASVSKLIAVSLIFLIPSFVSLIADISSANKSYLSCLSNATSENIESIRVSDAKIYLGIAKNSLKRNDYNQAMLMINKVKSESEKNSLLVELKEIDELIKAKEKKEEEDKKSHQKPGGNSGGNPGFVAGVSGSVENIYGVYLYHQCDPRWGNIQYDIGGGSNGGPATLCSSSCGYTSFAMIAAGLNNDVNINPYSVIKYMRNIKDGELTHRGYGAASWDEIAGSNMVSHYNLNVSRISRLQIESSLNSGPVIALVPGHYIVLSKSANGNVVLLDPFNNWANANKKSGEFRSVSDIESIYGMISGAAVYTKK